MKKDIWVQESENAIPPPSVTGLRTQQGLTQSADGAVVGLVAQGICAGVTEAEVATGQNQGVPDVGETHHALGAVITHFILSHLAGEIETEPMTKVTCFLYKAVCLKH